VDATLGACAVQCMAWSVMPLRQLTGDEEGTVSLSGRRQIRMARWSASVCIGQGGRQKGVKLTVHGGGAATAADGEVWAVSGVDLHDREMVKSSS
jgi:hypothetical protein